MPTITITDDRGNETKIEIENRTAYAAGLGIKERIKLYIDPETEKPYDDEVKDIYEQLLQLEKGFKSVIQRER